MTSLIADEINPGTQRSLWIIAVISSLAQSMAGTFVSYFGVNIGVQKWEQSIIVSSRNLGNSFFQPYWGRLSDTYGRMPFLACGAFSMAVFNVMLLFVHEPIFLILLVILQSTIGIMFYPAYFGLIGDCSTVTSRGRLMGKLSFLGLLFSVIGIMLCGFLMDASGTWLSNVFIFPFIFSMITWVLVGIIAFLGVRQPQERVQVSTKKNGVIIILKSSTMPFRRLLLVSGVYQVSMAALWPLIPFLVMAVANTWTEIAFMWTLFTIPQAIFSPVGGWLGDKFNRKTAILLFRSLHFLIPLFYFSALLTGNYLIILTGGIISGIAIGGGDTNINSLALDLAPEMEKASYIAMLSFIAGLVGFLSSLGSGILTDVLEQSGVGSSIEILGIMLLGISALRLMAWVSHSLLKNPSKT
ncbi:MAG: MFS transporter [Candidatus Hermodarchaeota archaeon]